MNCNFIWAETLKRIKIVPEEKKKKTFLKGKKNLNIFTSTTLISLPSVLLPDNIKHK